MKLKKIALLLIVSAFVFSNNVFAKNVKGYFSYASFNTPDNNPYIETYLSIVGGSVTFSKNAKDKFQASVEVGMLFTLNKEVKLAKKFNLLSPEVNDTNKTLPVFIDQQRFQLPNGNYILEVELTDKFGNKPTVKFLREVNINFEKDSLDFSDVEFIETYAKATVQGPFTKSGYDFTPYNSTYFHDEANKLSFYAELYNTNKVYSNPEEKFLLTWYIQSFETGFKLTNFIQFAKYQPGSVIPLISEFNLEKLPSGNYNLVIEIKDKKNKVVLSKKTFFQRSNSKFQISPDDLMMVDIGKSFVERITNNDTLNEYIRCLRPIATPLQVTFIETNVKQTDITIKQKFLYAFWVQRDALNPETAFKEYMHRVSFVNEFYDAVNLKGYQTDRGRVYLKYGKPDQMTKFEHEPNNYPYEIWQYYKLDKRNNRKFIFYNPDLASNKYTLLHSDAIGEIKDERWQAKLSKRSNNQNNNFDNNGSNNNTGNRAGEFFDDPR